MQAFNASVETSALCVNGSGIDCAQTHIDLAQAAYRAPRRNVALTLYGR
jgi:hypothetical protein